MCLRSLVACVNCDGTLLSTCMKTGSLRSSMPVGQLLDLISYITSTDTVPIQFERGTNARARKRRGTIRISAGANWALHIYGLTFAVCAALALR